MPSDTHVKVSTSEIKPGNKTFCPGEDPERDAWCTAFFIENHIDHLSYPEQAASPEQVRFMVYTDSNERYFPCSDRMFEAIMDRNRSLYLQEKYREVLQRVIGLIDKYIEDPYERDYLRALISIKYNHETKDEIMIPSRLEKRLIRIFIKRTQIEDPYVLEKECRNRRTKAILESDSFQEALNTVDDIGPANLPATLTGIKQLAELMELKRLLTVSVERRLWDTDENGTWSRDDFISLFERSITGNGVDKLFDFTGVSCTNSNRWCSRSKKILWLADESGEIIFDIRIIRFLVTLGHKVIVVFKEGPLYTKTNFQDVHDDPILSGELKGSLVVRNKNMRKNELVNMLRSDHDIIIISDGIAENLNLLLTSTTFARIFKEVDGVISRGEDQKRRLFDSHFQYTQDIYSIASDDSGRVIVDFKPRHPDFIKFSHEDLEIKAGTIIDEMKNAKRNGMTVIFYSGIIGSIPGKITMAKQVMQTFINHLKSQLSQTYIINPSEHYEPGMDADDLMYMWEIVQRSGLIDIWRFQSYDDISTAFQLMKVKVPPEWVGKDATFSTGCTKEMKIALEVQQAHPEMQLIGPSKEKFMRRAEYGVGMMYDRRLIDVADIG